MVACPMFKRILVTWSVVLPKLFINIGSITSAVKPPACENSRSSPTVLFKPSANILVSTTLFSDTERNSSPRKAPEAKPWAN